MASTKIDGRKIGIYTGTTAAANATGGNGILGAATSHKLNINRDMADVTTKDSNNWKEIIPTLKSYSIDIDALTTFDETNGAEALNDALLNGTLLYFRLSTEVTGDEKWYGSGYISKFELNGKQGDASSYSCTIEGTGALTRATIT